MEKFKYQDTLPKLQSKDTQARTQVNASTTRHAKIKKNEPNKKNHLIKPVRKPLQSVTFSASGGESINLSSF